MKIRYRIFNLIVAVLLIAVVIGNVFAWFSAKDAELEISGASAGAYFAYGNGKKDKDGDGKIQGPYGITTPTHLFNLAWLQNAGKIDPGTYFELGADITIEKGYVLPPIGNATNPFNSVFNGNGHTIDGLIVSTNKNVLHGNPADADYTFSNAVGMFGMTETKSEIKNFILTDPTVEVSNVNTTYSAITSADPAAVGLAIGYVNGKASSIGVKGGKYSVLREMSGDDKYKTYNSILGGMSKEAENNNSITGGTEGSNKSDTGIFYPDDIYKRLTKKDPESNKSLADTDFPSDFTFSSTPYDKFVGGDYANASLNLNFKSNIWINSAQNNYLGLGSISFTTTAKSSDSATRIAEAHTFNEGNIFYCYETKPLSTSVTYNDNLKGPYYFDKSNDDTLAEELKSKVINLKGEPITQFFTRYNPQGGINSMSSEDTFLYDEDGTLESTDKYDIQSRSVKVNVVTNNAKVIIVAASNTESNILNLNIYKAADIKTSTGTVTPYYSEPEKFKTGLENGYKEQVSSPFQTIRLGGGIGGGKANARVPIVVEIDLSSIYDENNNLIAGGPGAYLIAGSASIGIYYAKITGMEGGNADTGELGEGLSAIDFIYDDVTINQEEVSYTDGDNGTKTLAPGNFIYANKLYTASQVRIYYDSISATLYISFARTSTSFDVTYNNEAEPQTSGSGSVKFKYASAFTFTVP